MSEILCTLVTGYHEYRIDSRIPQMVQEGLVPPGTETVVGMFQSLGHVDDLLTLSGTHCGECVDRFQQHLLPEIGYTCKGKGRKFRYLQMCLEFFGLCIRCTPHNPNEAFGRGTEEVQEVARGRPCVGYGAWTYMETRNYVLQKLSAHRQVAPGQRDSAQEIVLRVDRLVVAEVLRLGYKAHRMYRIWRSLPPSRTDAAVKLVRAELRQMRRMESGKVADVLAQRSA